MKALVTGGAGFIGSHVTEALCRCGAKVIVLDNLAGGKLDNLAWRKTGDEVEFIEDDVRKENLLRRLLPGCDLVLPRSKFVEDLATALPEWMAGSS